MIRQPCALLASAPALAFCRAPRAIAIQRPEYIHKCAPCAPFTPSLASRRPHGIELPPARHRITSEHLGSQRGGIVLAKRHHGTLSASSTLPSPGYPMFPYSPSNDWGLVQGSHSIEETRKPIELDIPMSKIVESVESRTCRYPSAEGVCLTYLSHDARRELFKAAVLALTHMRDHELDIRGVIDSTKGKLSALYLAQQRSRSLSTHATEHQVIDHSKDRVRTSYTAELSTIPSSQNVERLWREMTKRDAFSVWLFWNRDDNYWDYHVMEKICHSYLACFVHLRMRKALLDEGTNEILTSKVALDVKASHVSTLACEALVAMKQLASINLTSRELLQAMNDPANVKPRIGARSTSHSQQLLYYNMVIQLEKLAAAMEKIETFVRASAVVLMELDLLKCGLLGHAQTKNLTTKFTTFMPATCKKQIEATQDSSAVSSRESHPRLRQIQFRFVQLIRDIYNETRPMIGEFEQLLMKRSKDIEASKALLPLREAIRRSVLYRPSAVYKKYCLRTKTARRRQLRQSRYLSSPERMPQERNARRKRVRVLRAEFMKGGSAVQRRGVVSQKMVVSHKQMKVRRVFAYKQHLQIRKYFDMGNSIRNDPVQFRLKLRAARTKPWCKRWKTYIRRVPTAQIAFENIRHTLDDENHMMSNRNTFFTPAKQRRRREKRMLQGDFPPIVNITWSSPTLTLGNTNKSLARVLGILGFEENFGAAKSNDVSKRDKDIHNQPKRCSTHNSLTRFTPSPRMQAPHTAFCYAQSRTMRSASGQHELVDTGNDTTTSDYKSNEGAGNSNTYHNNAPSNDDLSTSPLEDNMREDVEQPTEKDQEDDYSGESDVDSESEDESDQQEETHIPLSFQIPEETLREAMQASPNSQASFYSHLLYRGLEDQTLPVHYCRTMEVAERAAKWFVDETVLGFDIEWKPWASPNSIKDNASLIQIASEDRIALFHISLFEGDTPDELVPPTLKTILESPKITKVGVAIKGDFTRLKNHLGIEARGVFEISRLHNIVEYHAEPAKITKKLVSLARQTHQHLQLPLSKGDVRESDWSKELDRDQIRYAATDAYVGLRIFDVLEAKRKKLRPTPPLPGLCDSDEKLVRRTKAAPQPAVTNEEDGIPNAIDILEQEEDTEYETAPEDLMDSHDFEATIDPESEPESSNESHPDAGYVPQSQRVGQASFDSNQQDGTSPKAPLKTRRVGRVKLSKLNDANPGYPKLPQAQSENESNSDSSDAFDPPPKTRLRRRAVKQVLAQEVVGQMDNDHETDEFEDKEVEELMSAMEIDDVPHTKEAKSILIDIPQHDGELLAMEQPRSSTMLEQKEDGESLVVSATRTAPGTKEKKKRKPKAVESTSTEPSPSPSSSPNATLAQPQSKAPTPDTTPKSPEYLLAETWAQAYVRATIPSPSTSSSSTSPPSRIRATVPHIRAYHLWHHQRLPLDEVAGHLRDPPLALSTVLSYIAQAVDLERLEYRNEDLRVVLAGMPLGLRMGRYRRLVDRVGGRGGSSGSGSGSDVWF